MKIDIHSDDSAIARLAPDWDSLVRDDPDLVRGLDVTASYVWLSALRRAHLQGRHLRVVVARDGTVVTGLLPVVVGPRTAIGRRLYVAAHHYCGRTAPLLGGTDDATYASLLGGLDKACPDWASLDLAATQGSPTHLRLQAAGDLFAPDVGAAEVSPYFALGPTAEAFWSACSKSTRQQVRTSRNKLEAAGGMEIRLVTGGEPAQGLIDEVLAIERASWKHDAGTAITRHPLQEAFYRAWFPIAADAGLLFAAVLYVAGRPVAHNVGVLRDGVFCCLKHSHDQGFEKASPAYPLTAFLIDELMVRGAHTFDFMGRSEPHKLRWSPATRTYARLQGRLYRNDARGRALAALDRIRSKAGSALRRWRTRLPEAAA